MHCQCCLVLAYLLVLVHILSVLYTPYYMVQPFSPVAYLCVMLYDLTYLRLCNAQDAKPKASAGHMPLGPAGPPAFIAAATTATHHI